MSSGPDRPDPFDPFGVWRGVRDANMDAWSKMMIDFVNSDEYAQATARMLDSYLAASAPFQQFIENTMSHMLAQLNMPSRSDITSLAERLTNLEVRLDDIEAKLDALQSASAQAPTTGPAPTDEEH